MLFYGRGLSNASKPPSIQVLVEHQKARVLHDPCHFTGRYLYKFLLIPPKHCNSEYLILPQALLDIIFGALPASAPTTMAVPPSPTLSARTTATTLGMAGSKLLPPHLVTRSDLRASLGALESLLTASKAYTSALLALGSASSELGVALEACSRSKGAHHVGSGLLATSGIHFMASNSLSILADAWWRETAIPLLEHHDMYTQACADRITQHERTLATKSKELNEAEARNRKEAKSKHGRDLGSFRRALAELQKRVDELDEEKARYYHDILESEEESWSFVQDKVSRCPFPYGSFAIDALCYLRWCLLFEVSSMCTNASPPKVSPMRPSNHSFPPLPIPSAHMDPLELKIRFTAS